jgi:phage shock protein C
MGTRLYRSRDDRMLAGVAGGLAELWDADPSVVRILWALLIVLTGGIALVVYIVMAIVVPEEGEVGPGRAFGSSESAPTSAAPSGPPPSGAPPGGTPAPQVADWRSQRAAERESRREARRARRATGVGSGGSASIVVGALLVILGGFFLVRQYLPSIDFDWVWPSALVLLGLLVIFNAVGRGDGAGPGARQ